ncbi:chemotaxis protein CheA [Spirochaeta isovalerica]|uniref:Chemotaxis protein CheA n=1 Tax=Spirochaeta isovalerica TaxID=150 RepID=A0A841R866_9SPIO|nr:chemotaxis protein CheA [Spirochaeta isovalerica]MBB6481474.1 two-component system chemotaxis sensor kinase CheA [Spirochaeta isovalerica]
MTANDFFTSFSGFLDTFTPGDLVGTMEFKEFVDEGKEHYPPEGRSLFLDLSALLHCYILEGENDELNSQFESLKAKIGQLKSPSPVQVNQEKTADDPMCPAPVKIDDREVLDSFLQESHDHLDTIEERILALETNPDTDLIDDIFRSMHTIKGVASFIGLNNIKNISHTLESLLDRLRDNELAVDSDLISVLLDGTDVLSNLIACIERDAEEKRNEGRELVLCEPSVDISLLVEKISLIGNEDKSGTPMESVETEVPTDSFDDLITGEMIQKFIEETSDLLDNAEHEILELENGSPDVEHVDRAFRKLHTIKGNAGFFGFEAIEETAMETESLLDEIRKGKKDGDHRNVSIILKQLDIIRARLSSLIDQPEPSEGENNRKEPYKPIGDVLIDLGVSREDIEHAANLQNKKLGEILIEEGVVSERTLDQALQSQNRSIGGMPSISVKRKDIRIDMDKLDRLFDMVGELITAEAMVVDSEDLKGMELRDFQKSALHLSKITREIQSITMSMRMIPLEGLFNKMKRLVRDLSRKMDKPVQLNISGADTEMDRNVIEEISDPLVHIIRNAIDHGLENRSERSGKGKPSVGSVNLDARYEGNEIWITVSDDGAGLNRERIVENAMEKGLLSEEGDDLPDEDIWKLIFEPGFSTTETVSEISGRGVGMDVVKRNIEKLRGRIDIQTEWGKGTDMVLRIPLTLAIIDAISCMIGSMTLAFQSSDVIEFLKYSDDLFTHTGQGNRVINLRSEIIPVIELWEFYNIRREQRSHENDVLVVITAGGVKSALIVDSILGSKQMVVKALPELLEETRAISGCSVLGNGDVCLIVDAAALIRETLE